MFTSTGTSQPDAPLPREFYARDVVVVARELLGKLLVRESDRRRLTGRVVEVEAYLAQGDSACHGARGRTRRNASMFGPAGHAYVYSIHAHWCLNAVTEDEGVASAVLIRAVEPIDSADLMARRRRTDRRTDLTRGPARLCEAFGVNRALDGWDLTHGERLWICAGENPPLPQADIGVSPRIGVTSAREMPLRFFVAGNPFVSGPRGKRRCE